MAEVQEIIEGIDRVVELSEKLGSSFRGAGGADFCDKKISIWKRKRSYWVRYEVRLCSSFECIFDLQQEEQEELNVFRHGKWEEYLLMFLVPQLESMYKDKIKSDAMEREFEEVKNFSDIDDAAIFDEVLRTAKHPDKEIRDWLMRLDWDYVARTDIPKFAKKWGVSVEKMERLIADITHG